MRSKDAHKQLARTSLIEKIRYFDKICFQLPQNVMWTDEIMCAISTRTGINEVRLAYHISLVSTG